MSDEITCSVCHKEGRRRMGRHCPEGWFYGEFIDEENPERGSYVLAVCSQTCAGSFWLPGPGNLTTVPPYIRPLKANMNVDERIEEDENG